MFKALGFRWMRSNCSSVPDAQRQLSEHAMRSLTAPDFAHILPTLDRLRDHLMTHEGPSKLLSFRHFHASA